MRNKIRNNSRIFLNNTFHDVDVSTFSVIVIGFLTKSILHVILLQSSLILHPSPRVVELPQEPPISL